MTDIDVPTTGTFINDTGNLYYQGILPAGGPPPAIPVTTNPSNAQNRVEPVLFTTPGTYLVICNVRPHFLGGMVHVRGGHRSPESRPRPRFARMSSHS